MGSRLRVDQGFMLSFSQVSDQYFIVLTSLVAACLLAYGQQEIHNHYLCLVIRLVLTFYFSRRTQFQWISTDFYLIPCHAGQQTMRVA